MALAELLPELDINVQSVDALKLISLICNLDSVLNAKAHMNTVKTICIHIHMSGDHNE